MFPRLFVLWHGLPSFEMAATSAISSGGSYLSTSLLGTSFVEAWMAHTVDLGVYMCVIDTISFNSPSEVLK